MNWRANCSPNSASSLRGPNFSTVLRGMESDCWVIEKAAHGARSVKMLKANSLSPSLDAPTTVGRSKVRVVTCCLIKYMMKKAGRLLEVGHLRSAGQNTAGNLA